MRRSRVAGASSPNRTREVNVGFGPAEALPGERTQTTWRQRQFGRLIPLSPFERIACRDSREGIGHLESLRLSFLNLDQFIEHLPCPFVLRALQVGISKIVHCVKLLIPNA